MQKKNTLILLVHPLWNLFFENEKLMYKLKNVNDTQEITPKDLLKEDYFRIELKNQVTTYTNTVKNLLRKNKNAHVIIFFPNIEKLQTGKEGLNRIVSYNRNFFYWKLLEKSFNEKLKEIPNVEISDWYPLKKITKENLFKHIKIKPSELERNIKIISFGEQYDELFGNCVRKWTERIRETLQLDHSISSTKKILKNATLEPGERFSQKINKLQKVKPKRPL